MYVAFMATRMDHEKANRRQRTREAHWNPRKATEAQWGFLRGLAQQHGISLPRKLNVGEASALIDELKGDGPGPVAASFGCASKAPELQPRARRFMRLTNEELMGLAFALRIVVAPVGDLREELQAELAHRSG